MTLILIFSFPGQDDDFTCPFYIEMYICFQTIVQVERFLRKRFNLSKGPTAEKIHIYYLSNGDAKWRVKAFSEIKDRRLCLTNIIMSTKPSNFYCNVDPVGQYKMGKGITRSKPTIPRGELAPHDKYTRVSEMMKITEATQEEKPPSRKYISTSVLLVYY